MEEVAKATKQICFQTHVCFLKDGTSQAGRLLYRDLSEIVSSLLTFSVQTPSATYQSPEWDCIKLNCSRARYKGNYSLEFTLSLFMGLFHHRSQITTSF